MTAKITTIVDAVVADLMTRLDDAKWLNPTVRKTWYIHDMTDDLPGVVTVTVSGEGRVVEKVSRVEIQDDLEVLINVKSKLQSDENAEIETLIDIVDKIITDYSTIKLASFRAIEINQEEQFDLDLISTDGLFSSVFSLTFRGFV